MKPADRVLQPARQIVYKFREVVRELRRIHALATDPALTQSYYPGQERKSRARIALELLLWYVRHGDVNHYYYVYGFDRAGVDTGSYFPYPSFRSLRDDRNHKLGNTPFNYICLLDDKFVFSQLLHSFGFPTPRVVALCDPEWVVWTDSGRREPLRAIASRTKNIDGFCKPVTGSQGKGAFPLQVRAGTLWSGPDPLTIEDFKARLDGRFLLQERIRQHEGMAALHPESLNTMRVITFNNGGRVQVFSAAQRMGTRGRSVDNWTAGGILVGVDLETGRLCADGFYKPGYGGKVQKHPQTGITFQGFTIPYFQDAMQLVCRLHEYLYGIHSVGWDIAIRENGPVVIEGNPEWDGAVPMALEPDFKRRLLAMYQLVSLSAVSLIAF